VAGLLELARAFRSATPDRTLRFAFFTHGEPPYSQTDSMGSLVYAKGLAAEGVRVIAMMSLDSIGFYSATPGSQRYPDGFAGARPSAGDFVAIVGSASSRLLVERTATEMKLYSSLPVVSELHPSEASGFGWSDHWAFLQTGVASLVVTDTAAFRDPEHHGAGDLPERLDYDRMARVVVGLRKTLAAIVGEASTVPSPTFSPEPG
jgi:Zn-dependent M28 family amino/carboxypeptidase